MSIKDKTKTITTFHCELCRRSTLAISIFNSTAVMSLVPKMDIEYDERNELALMYILHPFCICDCPSVMIPYNFSKWLSTEGTVELSHITQADNYITHFLGQNRACRIFFHRGNLLDLYAFNRCCGHHHCRDAFKSLHSGRMNLTHGLGGDHLRMSHSSARSTLPTYCSHTEIWAIKRITLDICKCQIAI